MSAVRRFFCLFVTFDVLFIGFLWIISVVVRIKCPIMSICPITYTSYLQITGENIYKALDEQVAHYTIYTSLFDVVVIAIIRFLVLIFFYGVLSSSHWIYIAVNCVYSVTHRRLKFH